MTTHGQRRDDQGVAIITVLLVLSILAVIGLGIATMGQGHMAATVSQTNSEKAYMAAEAAAILACDAYSKVATPVAPGATQAYPQQALSTANPDTQINATIVGGGGTPPNYTQYTPPGSTRPVTIPPDHAYIVGCGNVNSQSIRSTVRYVGLMVHKPPPGGMYYFGAYAKNTLNVTGSGGLVDAWDSQNGAVPYSTTKRVPYADIIGSGTLTNVTNNPKLFGNVDGPTVNSAGANFNDMGAARVPGEGITLPNVPWPSLAPSPMLADLTVDGTTVTLIATGIPPLDNLQFDDVKVINGGKLRIIGAVGHSNFEFDDLSVNNGEIEVIPALGANVSLFLNRDANAGELDIRNNSKVTVSTGKASDFNMYYNGKSVKLHTNTKIMGTITATNPAVKCELFDNSDLYGSILSAANINMSNNFNLHYDISLKSVAPNAAFQGTSVGIVSHQRL